MNGPPVRACCSQRHYGVGCPDGLVMCCLCFYRVPRDRLEVLDSGELTDVCLACAELEESHETS